MTSWFAGIAMMKLAPKAGADSKSNKKTEEKKGAASGRSYQVQEKDTGFKSLGAGQAQGAGGGAGPMFSQRQGAATASAAAVVATAVVSSASSSPSFDPSRRSPPMDIPKSSNHLQRVFDRVAAQQNASSSDDEADRSENDDEPAAIEAPASSLASVASSDVELTLNDQLEGQCAALSISPVAASFNPQAPMSSLAAEGSVPVAVDTVDIVLFP